MLPYQCAVRSTRLLACLLAARWLQTILPPAPASGCRQLQILTSRFRCRNFSVRTPTALRLTCHKACMAVCRSPVRVADNGLRCSWEVRTNEAGHEVEESKELAITM